jgi:hypothetical protein
VKKILCHASWLKRTINKIFAVVHDKDLVCRAFFFIVRPLKMHGELALCHASEIKRTTKILTHCKRRFSVDRSAGCPSHRLHHFEIIKRRNTHTKFYKTAKSFPYISLGVWDAL